MLKVLDLQTLMSDVQGGMMVQSTESNNCGTVTGNETSSVSNGCPRETTYVTK
jgi:hypothetical protein